MTLLRGPGAMIQELSEQGDAEDGAAKPIPKALGHSVSPLIDRLAKIVSARASLEGKCESPIELDLGAQVLVQIGSILEARGFTLVPQWPMPRSRFDFAIVDLAGAAVLLIECDGKDFHSTPEQVANDQRKDALAANAGIPLLRFSGREIFHYADGCVHRVLEQLVRSGAV